MIRRDSLFFPLSHYMQTAVILKALVMVEMDTRLSSKPLAIRLFAHTFSYSFYLRLYLFILATYMYRFSVLTTPAFALRPWRKSKGKGLALIDVCCDVFMYPRTN